MKARSKMILIIILSLAAIASVFISQLMVCDRLKEQRAEAEERLKSETAAADNLRRICSMYASEAEDYRATIAAQEYKITALSARLSEYDYKLCDVEGGTLTTKDRLPNGATNMFMGMSYRKITDTKSQQYRLQQECYTADLTGIRCYKSGDKLYYCAALGGAHGIDIGDTWRVTLKNGTRFNIIHAEFKHPIDNPDPNDFGDNCDNYDGQDCTNVIEFVFDDEAVPPEVIEAGTFSKLDYFGGLNGDGGNIIEMQYTGRVWEP